MSAVVSDTSPLHYLIECEAIHILPALFEVILIPPAVLQELQHPKTPAKVRDWMRSSPVWLVTKSPNMLKFGLNVDEGERAAISLAIEENAVAILIDDRKGRIAATKCGLRVAGTIGLLETAASRGLVDFEIVIGKLQRTNARMEQSLMEAALKRHRSR